MARRQFNMVLIYLLLGLSHAGTAIAQDTDGAALIPVDPQLRMGTLANGLSYYVRSNQTPAGFINLRLVVAAGRIAQGDGETGVAHFVEHMAFEDTEHFPKGTLIPFLQSVGIVFGKDANASTGDDRTVYFFDVPNADPAKVDSALLVLQDWAGGVRFGVQDVEDERRVILEEIRVRSADPGRRALLSREADLYPGSPYASLDRSLQAAIVDTVSGETLRNFYHRWYRPDLMAVVVVGDFDVDDMENKVRQRFGALPRIEGDPLPKFSVPDHEETRVSIHVDPELTGNAVRVYIKRPRPAEQTLSDFRLSLTDVLLSRILNERLRGLAEGAEPPFLNPGYGVGRNLATQRYVFRAEPGVAGLDGTMQALLHEIERLRRFGVTESELDRARILLLSQHQRVYNERDRFASEVWSEDYEANFLFGDHLASVEYQNDQAQRLVPNISLAEVNDRIQVLLAEHNRVVSLSATGRGDTPVPSEADLQALVESVRTVTLEPFVDSVVDLPLLASIPTPGEIIKERDLPEVGGIEWTLENGARVVLVPTEFSNEEILLQAVSPGGTSLLEDRDYVTGSIAAHVIEASGVGPFSRDDLQKKLVGQAVSISPYIDSHAEGFRGSVSPTDVETLFQLTYQYFNAPRVAPSAFDNVIRSIGANIEAGRGNPNTILGETFRAEVWQHHLRQSNFTPELLAQAELDRVLEIYRDRFADAGDFTFFFVGKIDIEQMRQLARTYLATLPATGRQETWRDRGVRPVTGVVEKVIPVGAENISNTVMVFTGTYERSPRRDLDLIGLGQLLDVRVVTAIRTELGESYSPSVAATGRSLPVPVYQIVARFTSAPENADRLAAIVREQAEFLRLAGPIPEELAVLRTQGSFFFSLQLQNNEFLADQLASRHVTNRDLLGMLDLPRLVQESTAASLRESAQIFLNPANQVRIVQVPADFGMSVVQEDRRHSTPQAFALDENYPNPFNSDTIIRFALPRAAEVELAVYNLAGQKVVTLVQGERQAGQYEVRWDGRDQAERPLASGVYLYKLHADGEVANRSLLLLR